jgi:hypothetical protein
MRRHFLLVLAGSLTFGLVHGCGSTSPLAVSDGAAAGAGSSVAGRGGGSAGEGGNAAGAAGAGGSTAGEAGGVAGAGGAGGMTGTGGAGTAGTIGAGVAVCDTYCNAITAACTGAKAQYSDKANCMNVCSHLPAGTPTDSTGNTIGCRINAVAKAGADPLGCWFAGPLGFGTCGHECDVFCAIAMSYCSPAEGYTGTPPFASLDECITDCDGMYHQIDPTMPGIYSANYTPGATPETKDTNDCRAYHLFVNAFQSTAAQQTHCPHAANMSAVCGPGYMPPDANTDAPIPKYDLGWGKDDGPPRWNETLYPPDKRKMLLRDEGDPHVVMIDLAKTPALQWKTVAGGPWARSMQLIGNNQILGGRNDGYEVFDYTTGNILKIVNTFANTQSAYRMANGETMLTKSGTVLTFLDKNDTPTHQISYPGFGFVRMVRPTRNGTFLIPSDTTLFEGDAAGKVLWTAQGAEWGYIHEALLLGPPVGGGLWHDGDTLLCTAFGSSCDVVDQVTHLVTFRYGTKRMPNAATIHPNFFAEFEILPNGNIITSNWQGHGVGNGNSGIQVIEFNPAGDVVWFYKQDPTVFSSIEGVMVLDGKDPRYLHVQETSPDSSWQPVVP